MSGLPNAKEMSYTDHLDYIDKKFAELMGAFGVHSDKYGKNPRHDRCSHLVSVAWNSFKFYRSTPRND